MTRLLLTALAFAAPAAAAERTYPITDFDRIRIEGPFRVTLATGKSTAARATGDPRALDAVTVEVQGRTLRIRPNRSAWGGYPGAAGPGPVALTLTTRDLRGVQIDGSGSLTIDKVQGLAFDAALSGNGKLAIAAVRADTLRLGLTGGGTLALAGQAKSLKARISGAGSLDAASLTADDAEIAADTSGSIALAATRAVKLTASGAGDVTITGKAACTVERLGASIVRCGK